MWVATCGDRQAGWYRGADPSPLSGGGFCDPLWMAESINPPGKRIIRKEFISLEVCDEIQKKNY